MIKKVSNITELKELLLNDKSTSNVTQNRFPVRFILFFNFNDLKNFVDILKELGINILEISELLPKTKKDGWVTKDTLITKIKSLDRNKDYVILPFSEIVRFYDKNNFNSLFSQLLELENTTKQERRIYIPLLGLKERFSKEFYSKYNRKNEFTFTWQLTGEDEIITVYLSKKNNLINTKSTYIVDGTLSWLNLWKEKPPKKILCISDILSLYWKNAKPDELFNFILIENEKDFIEFVFNVKIPIKYDVKEKQYWIQLIKLFDTNNSPSISLLIKQSFNVIKISSENFIDLWFNKGNTNFSRWLLRHYALENFETNTYLYYILKKLKQDTDLELVKNILLDIFYLNNFDETFLKERVSLLKQIERVAQNNLPSEILTLYKNELEKISSLNKKLNILTGIWPFEKELLLKLYIETKNEEILNKLPDLKIYLESLKIENPKHQWITNYFKKYKEAKIKDTYTKEIKEEINELNEDERTFYKWYYSLDETAKYINADKLDYIYWIDALGIEWLNLIEKLLLDKGYFIERKAIARANIPTITDKNRYNFNKLTYIQTFDKFIHDEIYKYPKSIFKEIEKLKSIINKININKNKRAAIISDHGLSALVRLNKSSKNFSQAEHEGRYVKVNNIDDSYGDNNFIKIENYIIASKHISLSSKPIREVHGGCTPEEVIIPVIIFNSFEKDYDNYKIELLTSEIEPKNAILKFKVYPKPKVDNIVVNYLEQTEYIAVKGNSYELNLKISKLSRQFDVKIIIGTFSTVFNIKVRKTGFIEDELF